MSLRKKNPESQLKDRIKSLEKLVDQQAEQLERERATKWKIPRQKSFRSTRNSYVRFVIPDTHGALADKKALGAMLADLERAKPREIVLLGDHIDCGGFLAQHHALEYLPDTSYTFEDDVAACNEFLDKIQEYSPKAKIDYCQGNHTARIEKFVIKATLNNPIDAKYLSSMFSVESVLSLRKRGIPFYKRSEFYDGLSIPGTIKRGHCYFTHGITACKHAAAAHLNRFGGNVVFGHTHRAQSYISRTVKDGSIGAWCPGTLSVIQPLWMHTNPTEWSHGYGLQLVMKSGEFLHINVPIIDGKSYIEPLIKTIS